MMNKGSNHETQLHYQSPNAFSNAPRTQFTGTSFRLLQRVVAQNRWFTIPLLTLLTSSFLAILLFAPEQHRLAMLLAWVNMVILGGTMIYLLRQRTIACLIPIVFLVWPFLGWPLGTVYCGLFDSTMHWVNTKAQPQYILENNERVQLVMLGWSLAFVVSLLLFVPRNGPQISFTEFPSSVKRLLTLIAIVAIISTFGLAVSELRDPWRSKIDQNTGDYFAQGMNRYLSGLPLILGVFFFKLPLIYRCLMGLFLAMFGFAFMLADDRYNTFLPPLLILFGILFLSDWPVRRKLVLVLTVLFLFPAAMVMANATRDLNKGAVKYDNLAQRAEAVLRAGELLGEGSVVSRTMGRLFSTGGQAIILKTPEEVPYLEFDPAEFTQELIGSIFLPRRFLKSYTYTSSHHLLGYHLRIDEFTSVELSQPGAWWMLGGWVPLLFGSFAVGAFTAGVMHWVNRANRVSPYKALVYVAILIPAVQFGINHAPIQYVRGVIWSCLAAALFWHLVVRPLTGLGKSTSTKPAGQQKWGLVKSASPVAG